MKLYRHKVQYYETDQMGIVHHSNYIRWFEEARINLMDQMGISYKRMEDMGIISPVLSVEADFLRMVRFGGSVLIRAVIAEYNGIKLAVSYQVIDRNTNMVQCKGITRHCFLNEKGRPISLKKSFPEIHKLFEQEYEKEKQSEVKDGNKENHKNHKKRTKEDETEV